MQIANTDKMQKKLTFKKSVKLKLNLGFDQARHF